MIITIWIIKIQVPIHLHLLAVMRLAIHPLPMAVPILSIAFPKLRSSLAPRKVPWTPDACMVCHTLSAISHSPRNLLEDFRRNVALQAKTQSQQHSQNCLTTISDCGLQRRTTTPEPILIPHYLILLHRMLLPSLNAVCLKLSSKELMSPSAANLVNAWKMYRPED